MSDNSKTIDVEDVVRFVDARATVDPTNTGFGVHALWCGPRSLPEMLRDVFEVSFRMAAAVVDKAESQGRIQKVHRNGFYGWVRGRGHVAPVR